LHWGKAVRQIRVLRASDAMLRDIPGSVGVPYWFVKYVLSGAGWTTFRDVGEPDEAESAEWVRQHRERVFHAQLRTQVVKKLHVRAFINR
jgi:hypothetical protein